MFGFFYGFRVELELNEEEDEDVEQAVKEIYEFYREQESEQANGIGIERWVQFCEDFGFFSREYNEKVMKQ